MEGASRFDVKQGDLGKSGEVMPKMGKLDQVSNEKWRE